jgi:hypothetical protein
MSTRAARYAILAGIVVSAASAARASDLPPKPPVFVYDCDDLATITGRQFTDRLELAAREWRRWSSLGSARIPRRLLTQP